MIPSLDKERGKVDLRTVKKAVKQAKKKVIEKGRIQQVIIHWLPGQRVLYRSIKYLKGQGRYLLGQGHLHVRNGPQEENHQIVSGEMIDPEQDCLQSTPRIEDHRDVNLLPEQIQQETPVALDTPPIIITASPLQDVL